MNATQIAEMVFDEMRNGYDDINDLWYAWLFSRLHFLIAREVLSTWDQSRRRMVLDVGCGTGFQSFLYAMTGANVIGVDISHELIRVAREKIHEQWFPLFHEHFDFVGHYDRAILKLLAKFHGPFRSPIFDIGDACNLRFFADNLFDHVVCCGSTLSFIPAHWKALIEIARVLKPNGSFVLEVDATLLRRHHIMVNSSWASPILHKPVETPLKLFAKAELCRELESAGLQVTKCFSIHSLTSLTPKCDEANPGRLRQRWFRILAKLEERLPCYLPGHSLVVMGVKVP